MAKGKIENKLISFFARSSDNQKTSSQTIDFVTADQASDSKKIIMEIEVLRIISAFGIVYFHTGEESLRHVAYSGLVIFTIISVYLTNYQKTAGIFKKISRLGVPFLFWFVFYGVINYLTRGTLYPHDYSFLQGILATPSLHLWFIPFILFTTIVFSLIKPNIGLLSWGFAFALLITAPIWREILIPEPFGQYTHVLPAAFIGRFLKDYSGIYKPLKLPLLTILFLLIGYLAYIQLYGVGITYLFGYLLSLVLIFPKRFIGYNKILLTISFATFGVYLIHPFILSVGRKMNIHGIEAAVFAFIVSTILIILCQKIGDSSDRLSFLKRVC